MIVPGAAYYLKVYAKSTSPGGKVKIVIAGYFDSDIFTVREGDLLPAPPEEPPVAPVAG